MQPENPRPPEGGRSRQRGNNRYAWKKRSYAVPTPTRKGFQWKASALRSLQRIHKAEVSGHPATIIIPAFYSVMPAEAVALGWLNEIDALHTIRHRITEATKWTGWDVFTFHTRYNLDPFYASTISAVRETWLHEGSLKRGSVTETIKRYGEPYHYACISARLVENLVFQSSLMEWLRTRAENAPLRFHVLGTGLLSALVWSGSLSFEGAVKTALKLGSCWDTSLTALASEELDRKGIERSEENIGWLRFHHMRQILEGRTVVSLPASADDMPKVEAPSRPFWFSVTVGDEPVLLETVRDVQLALESMDTASWTPRPPRHLPTEGPNRVRGWLASPQHPIASRCRWSFYNYLLATPQSALLFLDHIAALGCQPAVTPDAPKTEEFQERLRLSRIKVTGP
jgi:hypothetical protein